MDSLYLKINQAWDDPSMIASLEIIDAIHESMTLLDQGKIMVA